MRRDTENIDDIYFDTWCEFPCTDLSLLCKLELCANDVPNGLRNETVYIE